MLVCFDIGGSEIKAGLAASSTEMRPLGAVATPSTDYVEFLARIIHLAAQPDAAAISISITGVFNAENGILKCANIPCADGQRIVHDLHRATHLPVFIFNDANCFALAEALAGAGLGHDNVLAIVLGSGVGGAQVLAGRVIEGAGGMAGDWGHGTILATSVGQPPRDIAHLPCGCGRLGCVNTIGGARGLEALHLLLHGRVATSLEILSRRGRDDTAAETVAAYMELVAQPLAYAVNITGASLLVAGGGLAHDHGFIAILDTQVRRRILRTAREPLIVPARHAQAGLAGAAIAGFQALADG